MPLFGRSRVTERDAAEAFVREIVETVVRHWPQIREKLEAAVGDEVFFLDDEAEDDLRELTIASVVCEAMAVDNLFSVAQAARVRAHIRRALANAFPESGAADVNECAAKYDRLWRDASLQGRAPWQLVAGELTVRLGIDSGWVEVGDHAVLAPTLEMAWASILMAPSGWWKTALQSYKLVER